MYRISDYVRITYERKGGALLDITRGEIYDMNPAASQILNLLERDSTEPEIVDAIAHEFQVGRSVAEKDVREFLRRLKEQELIIPC